MITSTIYQKSSSVERQNVIAFMKAGAERAEKKIRNISHLNSKWQRLQFIKVYQLNASKRIDVHFDEDARC